MTNTKKIAIVGSGIKTLSHLTTEAKAYITGADKVLHLVNEPMMQEWLEQNAKASRNLDEAYFSFDKRLDTYQALAKTIIDEFNHHDFICFVLYGHPTIFATIGLEALALAEQKQMTIEHVIIPGISAQDCLFADLKVDPGDSGCYSIDVNDLLLFDKTIEPHSHLILWQIGMIGNCGKPSYDVSRGNLLFLKERLLEYYPLNQKIYLYEASLYPAIAPKIECSILEKLEQLPFTPISSLYIKPLPQPDINEEALKRLGISRDDLMPSKKS